MHPLQQHWCLYCIEQYSICTEQTRPDQTRPEQNTQQNRTGQNRISIHDVMLILHNVEKA